MSSDSPLPPSIVVQHHGKSLFGPMREWKLRNQVPPVLLLTGQQGIGKRAMAYFLAQWILCEKNGISGETFAEVPCETCLTCRKALSGNGVDVTEIMSDAEEDAGSDPGKPSTLKTNSFKPSLKSNLKIDQFRKLKASAGFGAHEGRFKIILIPGADRMTHQAANSVLKLLEETPPNWLFFLTANDSTLLLPTLVSRCQVLRLKPFSAQEIQELLKAAGIPQERIELCAELSQGSWNRALNFASDEVWQQRKILFQFLSEPSRVLLSLIDWTAQDPSHCEILIDLLEQLTADLIRWSAPASPVPLANFTWTQWDGKNDLMAHAQWAIARYGGIEGARSFWIARAERLAQARQDSLVPLNRKLFAQDLLLPWLGANA